jgi:hypothetical protein
MSLPEVKALGVVIGISQQERTMETQQTHILTEQLEETGSRRSVLTKTLLGAAVGLLPASLLTDSAAAFRSLSGCKKQCDQFSGNCQTRCRRCCEKIYRGSKQRCNFGCGSIRPK